MTFPKRIAVLAVVVLLALAIPIAGCTSTSQTSPQSQSAQSTPKMEEAGTMPLLVAARDKTGGASMQDTLLIYESGSVERVISFDRSTKDAVEQGDLEEIRSQMQTHERFPTQISVDAADIAEIKECLAQKASSAQDVPSDGDGCTWYVFGLDGDNLVRIIGDGEKGDLDAASTKTIKNILLKYWLQS